VFVIYQAIITKISIFSIFDYDLICLFSVPLKLKKTFLTKKSLDQWKENN